MKVIHKRLVDCLRQKKSVALATIIETEGSTPQVTGASAIFSTRGLEAGTIGGGLLEAEIEKKSLQALKRQTSCLCRFSLNAEMAEDGAICGGAVTVLIDACPAEQATTFRHLKRSLEQRQPGMLATGINFITERDVSMYRLWIKKEAAAAAPSDQRLAACEKEIRNVFAANKPALLNIQGGKRGRQRQKSLLFLQPLSPQPQLVIVGAGHIGQAIAHLGSRLDFHVTLIDDRPEYANRKRAPTADRIIVADIGRSLRDLTITADTYIVIVTRGHRHDAEALRPCIRSRAAYVGMIGSRNKIEQMRKKFISEGWATPFQFDRVHAPIGLPIHSHTVEEIAVSIAAQLVLVRSQVLIHKQDTR